MNSFFSETLPMEENFLVDIGTRKNILKICKEIAFPDKVVGGFFYGSSVYGNSFKKEDLRFLLLINSSKPIIRFEKKLVKKIKLTFLKVDKRTFEKDVSENWLGGLLVENIMSPYVPFINRDYLWTQEIKAKRRTIIEILRNLVTEFPEMSHEIIISPNFFLFESMMRNASLFPLTTYRFLNIFRNFERERNLSIMLRGFKKALEVMANEGYITLTDGHVLMTPHCINTFLKKKSKLSRIFQNFRGGIFRFVHKIFPEIMRSYLIDFKVYSAYSGDKNFIAIPHLKLEDPKKHVFISTPLGLVSLSDNISIEDFIKITFPENYEVKTNLEKLGGVLNSVFILRINMGNQEKKFVVKVFKDWDGWKWFPLALWSVGTRGFAVFSKARLEKEYALNKFLSSQGVCVPKIVYISPKKRLLFKEYIPGKNLSEIMKKDLYGKCNNSMLIRRVGRTVADIHKKNVALGDCKPENIIITTEEKIFFVDLEQAERGGDQAWDLAEFLYYSSHYLTFKSTKKIRMITKEFLEGYLEAGGKVENVRKVRSPRYIKVFSFFTLPHSILVISNICAEILKKLENIKIDKY
jgi:Kae1-associated kinase Bud32